MSAASPGSPLGGRSVLLTRRWPDLAARLSALGATVAEVPAIAIRPPSDPAPLDAALRKLSAYDWVVFTSANAVEAVAARLSALRLPLPPEIALASVGPATTQAIDAAWPGASVALQPEVEFRAASLVEAFKSVRVSGAAVLLPVSDRAGDTVEKGLAAQGARVDRKVAYYTLTGADGSALRQALRPPPDVVAFASPSAVEAFEAATAGEGRGVPAVVIGPTTAEAARAAGLRVLAVAEPSTLDGLVEALVRAIGAPVVAPRGTPP